MFVPYSQSKIQAQPRPEDSSDLRLAAFVTCVEGAFQNAVAQLQKSDFAVMGYGDDRGVDRNGGRAGASEAPDEIRKQLYKMTPSPSFEGKLRIVDFGNLRSWGLKLPEAHEEARQAVAKIRACECRVITLGGGHDWAYADFADFMNVGGEQASSTGLAEYRHLINIDAHLDMRPLPEDPDRAAHSGTPFRRLLGNPNNPKLRVSVMGLQQHCNASSHLKWAQGNRVTTLFLEDMPLGIEGQWSLITDRLELGDSRWSYGLSIDMDAFAQGVSPGVSAPQPFGLEPRLVLNLIKGLGPRLTQLGIYEANPRFDRDGSTMRLAARFIQEFLMAPRQS
jgi:formimidoylglutamase